MIHMQKCENNTEIVSILYFPCLLLSYFALFIFIFQMFFCLLQIYNLEISREKDDMVKTLSKK